MSFFDFNWFAVILLACLPLAIIGMAAVIIRDTERKKRREKRLHSPIRGWREYGAGR